MDTQLVISFENTEIAFSSKSDGELKRSYYLFKLIGNPTLVSFGQVATNIALKIRFPIAWAIKGNIFKHFCGGENIAECAQATKILDKFHIGTILDYSVEGKESEDDLDATLEEILRTIKTAHDNPHIPFCVFKVTGIARFELLEKINAKDGLSPSESEEWLRVHDRVNAICKLSEETSTPIFIDAEDSWIQDAIDGLAEEMMLKYNNRQAIVFNTVQLYRYDRLEYLKALHHKLKNRGSKTGLKLVRGAYMEKERARANEKGYRDPIQPDKTSSDRDFNAALEYCVKHIEDISICCGSHNEESSIILTQLMALNGIENGDKRIFFAQLFGMSDHISFNLAYAGYNVAKYVPYGPISEVLPYLIRRAKENTSVKGQTSRELGLILKEMKRRGI